MNDPVSPRRAVRTQARTSPALLAALIFLMGVFAARLPGMVGRLGGSYDFFDPIVDVYNIVKARYVDEVDAERLEAMQRGAIEGMLRALDDQYAEYVPPADHADFSKALTGEYVGIGAQVTMTAGELEIVTPLEDSPAFRAGIMGGDRVTHIEGEPTRGLSIDECVDRLTGEPGTPVRLTIERAGETLELVITREKIVARSVKGVRLTPMTDRWEYWLDREEGIGLIRVTQFTPSTLPDFLEALDLLGAADGSLQGLIIDLRGNPGGLLGAAAGMVDVFLDEGVILSVRGRGVREEVLRASRGGTLRDFPIVVLVNGSSASGSEIVAGALKDHGRAVVLGTRTFGKGLVQAVESLPSRPGAQLKLTEQRYYLPSGRLIQRLDDSAEWGVDPSPGFFVPLTREQSLDRLLARRALDVLRGPEDAGLPGVQGQDDLIDLTQPQHWDDPAWIEDSAKDPQLAAALRAVRTRLAGGAWSSPEGAVEPGDQRPAVAMSELEALRDARDRLELELDRADRRMAALEEQLAGAEPEPAPDLWPDEAEIIGGTLEVLDAQGEPVARLRIERGGLEQWLIEAGLKPEPTGAEGEGAEPGSAGGQTPGGSDAGGGESR